MLTEQILAFCDPEARRYELGLPWLVDGQVCATDGRAIVSCSPDLYDGELAASEAKVPDMSKYLDIDQVPTWQEVPLLADCSQCGGTGRYEQNCPTCGGKTEASCAECTTVLGGRKMRTAYVRRFEAFPNCQWGVAADETIEHVFFRFDGGCGVLCPLPSD